MNDDVITPPTGVDDLLPLGKPIIVGLEVLGDVDGTVLGNDLNPDDVRIVITDVGTSGKPGDIIAGDNGGVFVLNPRGALDFFDNGDFDDLAPGEYRTTSITYTIGFAGPSSMFDVMLLQDLSGSFGDDIANVQAQYPLLIEDLTTNFDAQFGVASFVDKPILPFGSAGDYVYRTDVGITDDVSAIETAIDDFEIRSGNDAPEAQLEALLQLAVRADTEEIGFRDGAQRFVVLTTDANFHMEGDFERSGSNPVPDNDGDADVELEDYPTIAQVGAAVAAANITPIFLVTGGNQDEYKALVTALGVGEVVQLSADSDNIGDAIIAGLNDIVGQSTATITVSVYGAGTGRCIRLTEDNDLFAGTSADECIVGGAGSDTITGGIGNDSIAGNSNRDMLSGGEGDDLLEGQARADILLGEAGNDSLLGGLGRDVLDGGDGENILTGGRNSDIFVAAADADGLTIITDFTHVDRLALIGFDEKVIFREVGDDVVVSAVVSGALSDILLLEDVARDIFNGDNVGYFDMPFV